MKFIPQKKFGMVNVPRSMTPVVNGNKMPTEHPAMLTAAEAHMLKLMTDGQSNKTQFGGVPSFTDPSQARGNNLNSKPTTTTSSPSRTPTAMQGGFGAQAFGNSTASTKSVADAQRAGMSGGIAANVSRPTNSGTAVPGGYGAQGFGRSTTSQLPQQYQDQKWAVNGQSLAKDGVTHIGAAPTKYQDRIAPTNDMPMNIAKYQDRIPQQPPGFVAPAGANISVANVPQIPPSNDPMTRMMAGGYAQYPSGMNPQTQPAAAQMAGMKSQGSVPSAKAHDWSYWAGDRIKPTQVADTGIYNGPETPSNGIDANPANDGPVAQQPVNPFNGIDPNSQKYRDMQNQISTKNENAPSVIATNMIKKTPIGAVGAGLLGLLDQASGGLYGTNAGNGYGGRQNINEQSTGKSIFDQTNGYGSGAGNTGSPQVQTDPITGKPFVIDPVTGAKVPWHYPKYSQEWAGLPTGMGGYY